ncbi:MAG: D-alanyl-D-alanine carboxypeptidase/D-alanyl-D-alanine-endopeptidase [Planctomycetes bacterium]|nr:D-alanyl-D-alanine carboxypeptidase/D-alanyl-D-alanine-endopeptidase [Planctomycetota bacterium]
MSSTTPCRDAARAARRVAVLTMLAALPACHLPRPDTSPGPDLSVVTGKAAYRHAHWGLHVEDRHTGEVLLSWNGARLFAPASNTKLFSVAAAFEALGPDFRFETPVYRTGPVRDGGVLDGHLVLRASGDFTLGGRDDGHGGIQVTDSDHIYARGNPHTRLTSADPLAGLRHLAARVRAAGIIRARDVIVDDRIFRPCASTGSGPRQVTPIAINDNLLDFVVRPTAPRQSARVDWRPQMSGIRVESRVTTVAHGTYDVQVSRPEPGLYVLTGSIPMGSSPRVEIHEVADPTAMARRAFLDCLRRAGVEIDADAAAPNATQLLPADGAGLQLVASLVSAPFAAAARLILKTSHNLHASALPLLIESRHGTGELQRGLQRERMLLHSLGVATDELSFGGGAGGARADMATPRATVQLLRDVASRPWFEAFRDALPVLGVDGTLARVGTDSAARGHVRAKTGTYYVYDAMHQRSLLTSKALAGYIHTRRGRELVFSVVVNNVPLAQGVTTDSIGEDLGRISSLLYDAY